MSALGHMRTLSSVRVMSVLPPKADIRQRELHVRYVPIADIRNSRASIRALFQNAMRSLPPNKPIASSIYFVAALHSRGGSVRWCGIDKPSIQIGRKHLRSANGIGFDCEDVAVNHDQICALTDFETPG